MPSFVTELSSYFATGWVAVLEKGMIFFMVLWLVWCTKLYLEPDNEEKNNTKSDEVFDN